MKATKEEMKSLDRLQKRSDFLRVSASGKKWVSKSVIVIAHTNPEDQKRFGVTVTKKLEKLATKRNRMKRRLRAAAMDVMTQKSCANMDYVLIARNVTALCPYDALVRDLRWCLEKLGCLDA